MNNYNKPSRHPRYSPRQPQDDHTPSQDYMDRQLTNKARSFGYPATPDIASATSRTLGGGPGRQSLQGER